MITYDHVEGEELDVLAHRGGLGNVLLRVYVHRGTLHFILTKLLQC